jgi:hypothetical protein
MGGFYIVPNVRRTYPFAVASITAVLSHADEMFDQVISYTIVFVDIQNNWDSVQRYEPL